MSDVLTDNYFTMIFSLKKTKIESLTRQQITATIIALSRAWPDHAGWNLFSISVPPPIPNAMWSRAGTSVKSINNGFLCWTLPWCPDNLVLQSESKYTTAHSRTMLLGESKQCHTGWHIDVIKMSVLQNFNFFDSDFNQTLSQEKEKLSNVT